MKTKELEMYNKAFLFNGIGSKPEKLTPALPPELYDKYISYFDTAFERLGLCKDIDKNTFTNRRVAEWIVSLLCDRVIFEYLISKGITPDIGAGYSMGIVSLGACFGCYSHEFAHDIIMTTRKVTKRISDASADMDLGVVIGFSYDDISELLKSKFSEDDIIVGSGNSKFHTMLSGKTDVLEKALEYCNQEGALKTFRFDAGIAFHHPSMKQFADDYVDICGSVPYNDPLCPIISVFNCNVLTTAEDMLKENQLNIYTPIRWDLAIKKLEELGVKEFYDMSANSAVKKFSRFGRKCKIYTIEDFYP